MLSIINGQREKVIRYKVVGDYINAMKTTFDFNFHLYQGVKQHGYK